MREKKFLHWCLGAAAVLAFIGLTAKKANAQIATTTTVGNVVEAYNMPLTVTAAQNGTLTYNIWPNRNLVLSWPQGTLSHEAAVRAELLSSASADIVGRLPHNATLVQDSVFRLTAVNNETGMNTLFFDKNVSLRINLPLSTTQADLGLYYYDAPANRWLRLPHASIDRSASVVTFETNHLGTFAVFQAPGSPVVLTPHVAAETGGSNNTNTNGVGGTPADNSLVDEANARATVAWEKSLVANPDMALTHKLSGEILLQVEQNGEAWYVNPADHKRYFLSRPNYAFDLMSKLAIGVSNSTWTSFTNNRSSVDLNGRFILKVEDAGRLYYARPNGLGVNYIHGPEDAWMIMRNLSLGITDHNIRKIAVGDYK